MANPSFSWRDGAALLVAVVICFGVAAVGSVATASSVSSWYLELTMPSWNPPSWVFGPVWTLLYAAMAVAAWLVWRSPGPGRGVALGVFGVQLALNGLWSWLFFGFRRIDLAFYEILVLWLAIAATIWVFRRISSTAAWLLVPYLAWVSFAAVLNAAILSLNR